MRSMGAGRSAVVAATLACMGLANSAHAFTFSGESMENFSGSNCDTGCSNQTNLSYTHDQVDFFVSRMTALGHTKKHQYKDASVWASDPSEDYYGGEDDCYSDDGDIYIYGGHGGGPTNFVAPMCKSGSLSSCIFGGDNAVWGERSGGAAIASPGNIRFAFLMTCDSVDDNDLQWNQTFTLGFDYLFGYKGTSADSGYTDEVAGDMADEAFGSTANAFKASWFWAVEDWWINDTGSVEASGQSQTEANSRRDNITKNTSRRGDTVQHNSLSRAFHVG